MRTIRHLLLPLFLLTILAGSGCRREDKKVGGTLFIRLEAPATTMNPLLPTAGYSRFVSQHIFQTLGIIDPETLELQPLLVKQIPKDREITEGPRKGQLAYDFEIMDEANWDNGSPITGNDVAFSLKLIFNPVLPTGVWRPYYENITAVDINPDNPKKFTVYLREYYMLGLESLCQFPIYPAYHYDPDGLLAKVPLNDMIDPAKMDSMRQLPEIAAYLPVFMRPSLNANPDSITASGPYLLESLDPEQGATLVRKKTWWGDAAADKNKYLRAYPEKLVYRVVTSEDLTENMLRNGELDIVTGINPNTFKEWEKDTSLTANYDFVQNWAAIYNRLLLNTRKPELSDKKVRQALAYLVNYDYIVNNAAAGMADRSVGPINPAKDYYARNLKPYQMLPDKARQLLAEAGWTDSDNNGTLDKVIEGQKTDLEIDLAYSDGSPINVQIANSIQESFKQGGVAVRFTPMALNAITKETRQGNFDAALLAAAQFPGLVELHQYFHSESLAPAGDNRSGMVNPELDQLIDRIRNTRNDADRKKDYIRAQEILLDEVPEIVLYAPKQRYIISKKYNAVLSANRPGYYETFFSLK